MRCPPSGTRSYPQGDARGAALLARLSLDPVMAALREAMAQISGEAPNVDFALCALARALGLPADAPFTLFALGRSVGWVAHAMEQGMTGTLIRPRGRYEGVVAGVRCGKLPSLQGAWWTTDLRC